MVPTTEGVDMVLFIACRCSGAGNCSEEEEAEDEVEGGTRSDITISGGLARY